MPGICQSAQIVKVLPALSLSSGEGRASCVFWRGSAKMRPMDEPALISAAQKGDLDSFNPLVLAYQHQVYNLAYRIMGDAASGRRDAGSVHLGVSSPQEFSRRVVQSVAAAHRDQRLLRRAPPRQAPSVQVPRMLYVDDPTPDAELPPSQLESPEAFTQRRELNRAIQAGIAQLPPDQRIVLVLSDVQGMSYDEIAQITGANLGTVKSRLSRGRARLRDLLLEHGELLPAEYRLQSKGKGA